MALADGTIFRGQSIGSPGVTVGEVVFNTSMTGYQEILTDPSYAKQFVTLTYPHIGNYGTNPVDVESAKVFAEGLIVRDAPSLYSNFRAEWSLGEFLKQQDVLGLSGIDTRKLTRLIRSKGAQSGCLVAENAITEREAITRAGQFPGLGGMDLARQVSTNATYKCESDSAEGARYHVVAYDFGIKRNILNCLTERACDVTVVPATTAAQDVLDLKPDGVFYSNGPGDPEPCTYAIDALQTFFEKQIPIFGICLGHQILSLASGAKTIKMSFGHHGANHPVQDLNSKKVIITSQNHGFTVDETTLPENLEPTHVSLFDGSLQGVERTDVAAFGFQGHPEASPGPQDCRPTFDHFIELMAAKQRA